MNYKTVKKKMIEIDLESSENNPSIIQVRVF